MMVSDTQRASAAADVAYEMGALRDAWRLHRSAPFAWTAWFIHARNLMRFFDGTEDHEDDVLARHFFDPPGHWDGIRAQVAKPAAYTECEEAADKLAAHLTYGRADYRAQGFPPSQKVTDHLLGLALAFVTALPPEHRALFGRVLG